MRFNPFRTAKAAAPVAVGAVAAGVTAGAIAAGVDGLAIAGAATVAGAATAAGAVGAAALLSGRIVRKHRREELELTSQIQNGQTILLKYLTQSEAGQRLPATAVLLVAPDDMVERWTDELEEESRVAGKFPDDRLAVALSTLRLAIRGLRAFRTRLQIELLEHASKNMATNGNAALLLSLIGVGLSKKQAELLLKVAADDVLTLQEAVWLLILMKECPEVSHSLEKLLLEIRASSDDNRAERLLTHVQDCSIDAMRELLAKGIHTVDDILSKDELEQRLGEVLQACESITGNSV